MVELVVTFEIANEFLRLDADTGRIWWRERGREWFKNNNSWSVWNSKFAGKEAFTMDRRDGYRCGYVLDQAYLAHRIVWLLHTGSWPTKGIDHINGNKIDNRPDNLRDVSQAVNGRNQRMKVNNTSGVTGVSWRKDMRKWAAHINVSGKRTHLGYFASLDKATVARKAAEKHYGFHENHGMAVC